MSVGSRWFTSQDAVQATVLLGIDISGIPSIRAPCRDLESAAFSQPTDPDRESTAGGLRQAGSVVDLEVSAGIGCTIFGEQSVNHLGGLVQHVEASSYIGKRIAVCIGLPDVPTCSDTQLETAARYVIERDRSLRQQCGVAVADIENQATDPGVRGFRRQGAQGGQRFEVGFIATVEGRLVEVIPNGDPVDAAVVELAPQDSQFRHRDVLLAKMYAQRNSHRGKVAQVPSEDAAA